MVDEFAALTGHHRKHAIRLLGAGVSSGRSSPHPEQRVYDQAMREALTVIWETSDRSLRQAIVVVVANPGLGDGEPRYRQLAPEVLRAC